MSIGAGHIIPRIYYYLTPAFILLDYFGVANIRVAVLDSMPFYKNLYYGFCVVCGIVVFILPQCSLIVGLFESITNIIVTVVVLFWPYIHFIKHADDILTAELPFVAGVDVQCIGNILIACMIAVISFRGCIYELTMGREGEESGSMFLSKRSYNVRSQR
jgi:hypothetical protein